MLSGSRWRAAILVLPILLAAPGLAGDRLRSGAVAEAATLSLPIESSEDPAGGCDSESQQVHDGPRRQRHQPRRSHRETRRSGAPELVRPRGHR
jgi:hypothetical protein